MDNDLILKNVKGTFDFLPEKQLIRNKIINGLKEVFELYGYLPLETSIICSYELLASKYAGGSEILKEVYKLTDQGERNLALRYDLTVPFSKVIAANNLPLPFRRYEIGKVFRDGPVKVGRCREFYQCDVDVCGIDGVEVELELFSMAIRGYKRLGIDIELKWNNRKFLSCLISECGIKDEDVNQVILSVDKLAKIGEKEVIKEIEDNKIDTSNLGKLFNYFKMSIKDLNDMFVNTDNYLLKEGLTEILKLDNYIKDLNMEDSCIFAPFLARGLDIYTGTVWEIFDKQKRVTSSLGGGGRYDNIITKFINDGNEYPAVGMSFGLEPIYEIIRNEENISNDLYDIYIFPFDMNDKVLNIANILRNNNFKVLVEMKKRKLNKALDWANRNKISNVIILGEDELNNNVVTYRNMSNSSQDTFTLDELIKKLEKNIK